MDNDSIAIRLKGFIDSQGLTNSQFADTCQIPRPSLSQLLTGRNKKISDVIVGQIHHAYPELSVLWLMFGEGEMLVKNGTDAASGDSGANSDGIPSNLFDGDTVENKYGNLNGVNSPQNSAQSANNSVVNADLKILELKREIEKMAKNPRKVSHITVYYDDSTFETFYPRR